MIKRNQLYILLFCIISAFLLIAANSAVVSQFLADIPDSEKNEILLEWTVQEESNLMHYELKRKMVRDTDFMVIANIQATPPQAGPKSYDYKDRNVFRKSDNTEPVVYELTAVFTNGDRMFIGQAEVNYTSTAVRRTWGSIKAMFQ